MKTDKDKRAENAGNAGDESLQNEKGAKGEEGGRRRAAESFEELHVYQRARELTNGIYTATRQGSFARDYGLVDQIRRAGVSIMSNIAEGFERGSTTEFIQFLYIAKGSCGEMRAQLAIVSDQGYLKSSDHDRLYDQARRVSGMLSNFIAHLQSTDYQGEKFARPRRLADRCARREVKLPTHDDQAEDSK